MSPKKYVKKKAVPFREGYKYEPRFPKRGVSLTPQHGAGPRCRVDYNLHDDGPWAMVQIMRVDDDQIEQFTCAMPRYYAVPLILTNKRLAYFEAACGPDGTPLRNADGSAGIGQREFREYSYLWRMRSRFLQALFDMNHERRLDEAWRCPRIDGYVHRTYKRYGHDVYQRRAYWRAEIQARRVPYTTPDIADMDWGAYLAEEMTASTRLNAFLWNRVSQGYGRRVRDDPPLAGWHAWRRGGTSRDLSASLYRTPPPSPSPASRRPSCASEVLDSTVEQEQDHRYPDGAETSVTAVAGAAREEAAAYSIHTTFRRRGDMDYGGVLAATFDGSHDWALPPPTPDLSRGAGQAAANTGSTGDPSHRQISFTLDVPKDAAVTDILCTVSRAENISNNRKATLRVNYTSERS